MVEKEVEKVPGCTLIEVGALVVELVAGDRSHACLEEIEQNGHNQKLSKCDHKLLIGLNKLW